MKNIILSAFLALSLISCSDESIDTNDVTTTSEVNLSSFEIKTVQHVEYLAYANNSESLREDESNTFTFNSSAMTFTWKQQGEKDVWSFKVLSVNSYSLMIEEPATKTDVAHLIKVTLSPDKKQITLTPLNSDGSQDFTQAYDVYSVTKK